MAMEDPVHHQVNYSLSREGDFSWAVPGMTQKERTLTCFFLLLRMTRGRSSNMERAISNSRASYLLKSGPVISHQEQGSKTLSSPSPIVRFLDGFYS